MENSWNQLTYGLYFLSPCWDQSGTASGCVEALSLPTPPQRSDLIIPSFFRPLRIRSTL